jgi:hypothetical protein
MDVYEIITEKIINLLEQGVVPWRKPWTEVGADGLSFANAFSHPHEQLRNVEGGPGRHRGWTQRLLFGIWRSASVAVAGLVKGRGRFSAV